MTDDFLTKQVEKLKAEDTKSAPAQNPVVEKKPDVQRVEAVVAEATKPAEEQNKPAEITPENVDKIDLSKTPEPPPSNQNNPEAKKDERTKAEKLWWEDEPKAAEAEGKKNDDNKDDYKKYIEKANEYESLLKDAEVEAFLSAKKAGKSVMDFIEEIKPIDYNKMQPEALYEMKLKNLGLADDELKEALDEFNILPKWKKLEEVAPIKDSLSKEQSERLKKFTQVAAQQREGQKAIIQKAELDLTKKLDTLLDSEFYGMKITSNEYDVLKNTVLNETAAFNQDGTLDVERSLRYALVDKFFKQLMQANMNKARASAMEESFKEITRPTAKTVEATRTPVISDEQRLKDAVNSVLKERADATK